jgi:hypothetical protein
MEWDSASQCVLLFSGAENPADGGAEGPTPTLLPDTWLWDGTNWTQVEEGGPAPRFAFGLASDTSRNRVVLFGGANFTTEGPRALGDTWEWDGSAWTQQDETGPFARSGHNMTFDAKRSRTVLFSGVPLDGQGQSDTWEWNGTAWMQISEIGPTPRVKVGFCFDGSEAILFGGQAFPISEVFGDTWSWNGHFWTQKQDIGPQAREGSAIAFDSSRQKLVLFGGRGDSGDFNDTWEVAATTPT